MQTARVPQHQPAPHSEARPRYRKRRPQQARQNKRKSQSLTYRKIRNKSKHMPEVKQQGNTIYVYSNKRSYTRLPLGIVISLVIVFAYAMFSVLTQAQITSLEREIAQGNSQTLAYQENSAVIRSQLTDRYTLSEVEYIAMMYLGMAHPDPSQIIEISVPRQSHVVLNPDSNTTQPTENYFWQNIRRFVSGLFN